MRISRLNFCIAESFKIFLILAIIVEIFNKRWEVLFLTSLALFLTFLPAIIKKRYKLSLPIEFNLLFIFFIFSSLFLGEVRRFYDKIWWWDIFLHSISGIILGLIGFMIVYTFYHEQKFKSSPIFVSLFAFCFSLSIGTIWEFFEFFMDIAFGLNMQKSGLTDTMTDLFVDAIGGLIVSILGYYYTKYNKGYFLDRIIKKLRNKE